MIVQAISSKRGVLMGTIYAVANQKGGVGKSTTVVNLAAYLGSVGKKVLCIDLDAQGNTTTSFGIKKKTLTATTYDVLIGQRRIQDAMIETAFEGVTVVPATSSLVGGDIDLVEFEDRARRLHSQLLTCKLGFDYIFIDCPPSLSLLTLNGFVAADYVIVPMKCEPLSLEGLAQLWETVRHVKQRYNPKLDIKGVLFTMYDPRLNLTTHIVNEVKKHFPNRVFETTIPRNVRLSEAPSLGKPVMYYDPGSKGTEAYEMLGRELLGDKAPPLTSKKKKFGR